MEKVERFAISLLEQENNIIDELNDYIIKKISDFKTLSKNDSNKELKIKIITETLNEVFERYSISFSLIETPDKTKSSFWLQSETYATREFYEYKKHCEKHKIEIVNIYGEIYKIFELICDFVKDTAITIWESKLDLVSELFNVYSRKATHSIIANKYNKGE